MAVKFFFRKRVGLVTMGVTHTVSRAALSSKMAAKLSRESSKNSSAVLSRKKDHNRHVKLKKTYTKDTSLKGDGTLSLAIRIMNVVPFQPEGKSRGL